MGQNDLFQIPLILILGPLEVHEIQMLRHCLVLTSHNFALNK